MRVSRAERRRQALINEMVIGDYVEKRDRFLDRLNDDLEIAPFLKGIVNPVDYVNARFEYMARMN